MNEVDIQVVLPEQAALTVAKTLAEREIFDAALQQAVAERDRLRAIVMALRTYIRWHRKVGDDEDERQAFAVYAQEGLDMAVRLVDALDASGATDG